jgi:ferredoxin
MKAASGMIAVLMLLCLASCLSTSDPVGPPPEFSGYLQVDTGYTDKGDYWKYGHLSTFTVHWDSSNDAYEYQIRISPVPVDQNNWNHALLATTVPGGLDSCLVLLNPVVFQNTCISCGLCVDVCEQDAMMLTGTGAVIDTEECTACGQCLLVCPVNAVSDSRFNQAYYIAVRALSETGVPSSEIACSQSRYRMSYRNDESWCGMCNDGTTSTCWIILAGEDSGCPVDAIYWDEDFLIYIDYDLCIYCGNCFDVCIEQGLSTICKYVLEE